MKVKVRIAPSPTGFLHVGTAQSALYNWLFARKNGGEFHLRIEDTDKARSTKEYEADIIEGFTWLGIKWDGEITRSTGNQTRYQELLQKLIDEGKAFYCHHTQEELDTERQTQELAKQPPRHVCHHKNFETGKISGGIIRLAVDETSDRVIVFDDIIRGRVEFKQALLGDFSIGRAVNNALYHFAVVVDDADMKITHVLRGEDHLSNTPKHILIYEALEFPVPLFAHLPLIFASDRSKLSKRHGATKVTDYKKDYLPEAIVNFIGAMSFSFSKEMLTKEEMAQEFELSKVHKSGAVFDLKKLNWLNSQYIKKLSSEEFKNILRQAQDKSVDIPNAAVPLITERLEKLSDVENFDYFWKEPEYNKELLIWKNSSVENVKNSLGESIKILEQTEGNENIRSGLDELGKKIENRGLAYWPLRVALTGKEKSPDPVDVFSVLGKEESLKRIETAIKKLS